MKKHHTAYARGYVSRKNPDGYTEPYNGKFGKGYIQHTPCYHSTRYHYVTYFIEEEV